MNKIPSQAIHWRTSLKFKQDKAMTWLSREKRIQECKLEYDPDDADITRHRQPSAKQWSYLQVYCTVCKWFNRQLMYTK